MSVATSYAKALFQAAQDAKTSSEALDVLEAEMDSLLIALDSSDDARKALMGPVMPAKDKVAYLDAISSKAGYTKLFSQFLNLLANKGRLPALRSIREAFAGVRLEAEGGVAGRLVSAEPMSDGDVESLAAAFKKKLGRRVAFSTSTDANLLAGTKVTVNGVTYDGTLRAQLQQLRDRLTAGVTSH